jgi:hypothetical protein
MYKAGWGFEALQPLLEANAAGKQQVEKPVKGYPSTTYHSPNAHILSPLS